MTTFGSLPPGQFNYLASYEPAATLSGFDWERRCWFQSILPYVEEGSLHALINHEHSAESVGRTTEVDSNWVPIPTFMCPTDPNAGKNTTYTSRSSDWAGIYGPEASQGFHGNYVFCAGSTVFGNGGVSQETLNGSQLNGVAFALSGVRLAEIQDGTSHTFLGSEIILSPDNERANDLRGRYYNSWEGNNWFSTLYPPNTSVGDRSSFCISLPEAPCQPLGSRNVVQSARSYHPGGVNTLLCDGSVSRSGNSIDPVVWQGLGTRAGGEVETSP